MLSYSSLFDDSSSLPSLCKSYSQNGDLLLLPLDADVDLFIGELFSSLSPHRLHYFLSLVLKLFLGRSIMILSSDSRLIPGLRFRQPLELKLPGKNFVQDFSSSSITPSTLQAFAISSLQKKVRSSSTNNRSKVIFYSSSSSKLEDGSFSAQPEFLLSFRIVFL